MPLLTGITGYWQCDTNSSTQPDSVGSNDGTLNGSMAYTASGKINGGINGANGAGDYMDINKAVLPVRENSDFSVSMWIYPTAVGTFSYCLYSNVGTNVLNIGLGVGLSSSGTVVGISQESGTTFYQAETATGIVSNNTWHHIVMIQDGTSDVFYIFVDGVLRAKDPTRAAGTTGNLGNNLEVGREHTSNYWRGSIDEIGTWTKALTHGTTNVGDVATGEVAELYNSGSGLSYPFSVGYSNTVNGVVTPAKINGIAVANISKFNGV